MEEIRSLGIHFYFFKKVKYIKQQEITMEKAKKEVLKLLKLKKVILEIPPDPKLGDLSLPCFTLSKNPKKYAENLKKKLE